MNYTTHRSNEEATASQNMRASTHCLRGRSAEGAPLTSYKQVADIETNGYYGLWEDDLDDVTEKLRLQKAFLDHSYLFDRINQRYIPYADLVISAYHAPQRYYGEIQNRVNTLQELAISQGLSALFLTITLPSAYHPGKQNENKRIVANPYYEGYTPHEGSLHLTKMLKRLRDDRSYKLIPKDQRHYFKVIEPHKDGTPHLHLLLFLPQEHKARITVAFKRLFPSKGNKIEDNLRNAGAYVMKYINKILPLSKKEKLSIQDQYMNAWYAKHQIVRFGSSRSLAPLYLYRILHHHFSFRALTRLFHEGEFHFFVTLDTEKIIQINDSLGNTLYTASDNYDLLPMGSYINNSQTSESAIGRVA